VFTDPVLALVVKRRLEDRLGDAAEVFATVPVPARETTHVNATQVQP
jgi:hypothetical protein